MTVSRGGPLADIPKNRSTSRRSVAKAMIVQGLVAVTVARGLDLVDALDQPLPTPSSAAAGLVLREGTVAGSHLISPAVFLAKEQSAHS
ncbi:MAG: hypothetical protein OEU36_19480 [Gammaproteobacteria bacterium]|nr:hypothetical protein [Gammaproteobacteria bacterium]